MVKKMRKIPLLVCIEIPEDEAWSDSAMLAYVTNDLGLGTQQLSIMTGDELVKLSALFAEINTRLEGGGNGKEPEETEKQGREE